MRLNPDDFEIPTVSAESSAASPKPPSYISWNTEFYGAGGKGMDPGFVANLSLLAEDFYNVYGRPLRVVSGYRPDWRQAEIYNSGVRPAAPPGKSRHRYGLAVDIDRRDIDDLMKLPIRDYGFETLARINDPTHLQYAGDTSDAKLNRAASVRSAKISSEVPAVKAAEEPPLDPNDFELPTEALNPADFEIPDTSWFGRKGGPLDKYAQSVKEGKLLHTLIPGAEDRLKNLQRGYYHAWSRVADKFLGNIVDLFGKAADVAGPGAATVHGFEFPEVDKVSGAEDLVKAAVVKKSPFLKEVVEAPPLPGGVEGLVKPVSDYLRDLARRLAAKAPPGQAETIEGKILEGLGGLPAELTKYALPLGVFGPVLGMVGTSLIEASNEKPADIFKSAVHGYIMGKTFVGIHPLTKGAQVGVLATMFGALAAADGADLKDTAAATALGGILALAGKGGNVSARQAISDAFQRFRKLPPQVQREAVTQVRNISIPEEEISSLPSQKDQYRPWAPPLDVPEVEPTKKSPMMLEQELADIDRRMAERGFLDEVHPEVEVVEPPVIETVPAERVRQEPEPPPPKFNVPEIKRAIITPREAGERGWTGREHIVAIGEPGDPGPVAEPADASPSAPFYQRPGKPLEVGDKIFVGDSPGVVLDVKEDQVKVRLNSQTDPRAYMWVSQDLVRYNNDAAVAYSKIGELQEETQGKLNVNMDQIIQLLGHQMYTSNVADVAVKELVQNSFDAIKAFQEKFGVKKAGKIDISIDQRDRSITVTDDGIGMNRKILQEAFFTIGGSYKEELSPSQRSGGLGMAKLGFMFGADRIEVKTTRDGETTIVSATPEDIRKGNFKYQHYKAEKGEHGTSVKVWIPTERVDPKTGESVPVYFPYDADSLKALKYPLIGNVDVSVTDSSGKKTTVAAGRKFDTKKIPLLGKVNFSWGSADIYFGVDYKGGFGKGGIPKHYILSSGVYQFSQNIPLRGMWGDPIPYDIVIDIKPDVEASHPDYPFNNNREDFKGRIENDINAMYSYLRAKAQGNEAADLQQNFKNIEKLPRVDFSTASGHNAQNLKRQYEDWKRSQQEDMGKDAEVPSVPKVVWADNQGNLTDSSGNIINRKDATFSAEVDVPAIDQFLEDIGIDPAVPIFHNNTNFDISNYSDAVPFFSELGSILTEMKEVLAKSGMRYMDRLQRLYFSGISLDKSYAGVHITVPYNGIFLNPFRFNYNTKSLPAVRSLYYTTMIHEIAHTETMEHGESHNSAMQRITGYLAEQGLEDYFRDNILNTLVKYEKTFMEMRREFNKSSTTNRAKSFKDIKGNAGELSARRDESLSSDESAAVSGRGEQSWRAAVPATPRLAGERGELTRGRGSDIGRPEALASKPPVKVEVDWRQAANQDQNLRDRISRWLMGEGEKPPAPGKIYRGVPKGADFSVAEGAYTHGTPWISVAGRGGKGPFGEFEAYDIYSVDADKNTVYYRGGSLSGDPLEPTRLNTAQGMTWDEILDQAKALYRTILRNEQQKYSTTPKASRPSTEELARSAARSVVDDVVNATFETDMGSRPGIWAGREVPSALSRRYPPLRSEQQLQDYIEEQRRLGLPEDEIRQLPEYKILTGQYFSAEESPEARASIERARLDVAAQRAIDPSKLDYIGDMDVGPKHPGLHMFNINDPTRPDHGSTVSAKRQLRLSGIEGPLFHDAEGNPTRMVVTKESVQEAFGGKAVVTELESGDFLAELPNGVSVLVKPNTDVVVDPERYAFTYGEKPKNVTGYGSFLPVSWGGVIQLAKEGPLTTLSHEVSHAAFRLALTPAQRRALIRKYGTEEKAAKAYEQWVPGEPNTLFEKIRDFFRNLWRQFFPDATSVFRDIRSGKVWESAKLPTTESSEQYSASKEMEAATQQLAPIWYSRTINFLQDNLPKQRTGPQYATQIKQWMAKPTAGSKAQTHIIRPEEVKWSGLIPWLEEQNRPVTKQEILDFLEQNQVEIREVVRGPVSAEQRLEVEALEREIESINTHLYNAVKNKFPEADNIRLDYNGNQVFFTPAPGFQGRRWEVTDFVDRDTLDRGVKIEADLKDARNKIGPKFLSYMKIPPDAKNYRELYFTLPKLREAGLLPTDYFRVPDSHSVGDRDVDVNRFAHCFVYDRIVDGKKYLVGLEFQSDWGLAGRKKGWQDESLRQRLSEIELEKARLEPETARVGVEIGTIRGKGLTPPEDMIAKYDAMRSRLFDLRDEYVDVKTKLQRTVPHFPFEKTWHEVVMKRMLRYAAEQGYDGVAWVTGETIKDRYNLGRVVSEVGSAKNPDGTYRVYVMDIDGDIVNDWIEERTGYDTEELTKDQLEEILHKDLADKIVAAHADRTESEYIRWTGEDLKIGGEWAEKFYDKTLPRFLDKYGKQWGAKTRDITIKRLLEDFDPYHNLPEGWTVERLDTGQYLVYDENGNLLAEVDREETKGTLESIHSLDFTPSMRESILTEGQYMFSGGPDTTEWIRRAVDAVRSGRVDLDTAIRQPYRLLMPGYESVKDATKRVQSLALPTAKSREHLRAAEVLGAKLGSMNRSGEIAANSLREDRKFFDKLGVHDESIPLTENIGIVFMSDASQGRLMEPRLQKIHHKVSALFRQRVQWLEAAGAPLDVVRDNYFPGMWTSKSRRAFNQALGEFIAAGGVIEDLNTMGAQEKAAIKRRVEEIESSGLGSDKDMTVYLSRKPLRGFESFRKGKVFEDIMTGIEFGLKPLSNNPVDLVMLKLAEMDRSVMANRALREWESKGDVKFHPVTETVPKGWQKINDRYGTVFGEFNPTTGSRPVKGYMIARAPVAEILNNYLSTSLYNSPYFGPVYKALMSVGNVINQSQLGVFSLFHAGFTATETQVSMGAELIKDIYGVAKGNRTLNDVGRRAIDYTTGLVQPAIQGTKILSEWTTPTVDVPVNVPIADLPATPEGRIAYIAKAAELAGAGFKLEYGLQTYQTEKMVRDWYSGKKVKAALRSPVSLIELGAKPIMEFLVPRQKAGVFGELVGRILEQNPEKTLEELTPEFRQAWNRVDARLGQVRYNRLFIHNAAKNAFQLGIRAPGWTFGTIAEVGGAAKDAAAFMQEWYRTGKAPENIPDRVAYSMSLFMTVALINGLLTAAFTGEFPEGMDFLAFRDGGIDDNGNPTRWVMPTYMRDIYSWWKDPKGTITHKLHPMVSMMSDLWANKDFTGEYIIDPDATLGESVVQTGRFVAKQFIPFWMRGVQKSLETQNVSEAPQKALAPLLGIMPAGPKYTNTAAQEIINQYFGAKTPREYTHEEAALREARQHVLKLVREGKEQAAVEMVKDFALDHMMSPKQALQWFKEGQVPRYIANFRRMPLEVMPKVLTAATPKEERMLMPFFLKKLRDASKDPFTLKKAMPAILKYAEVFKKRRAAGNNYFEFRNN